MVIDQERDAHQCLKEINHMIMGKKVNWIIDADIKGFFDHVDHHWMMECLFQRISDPNFKSLIFKFLKAGVMEEEGQVKDTPRGTPQGGIISPILANIYLHYVLDLWFKVYRKKLKGYTQLVRYADDFIIGVQYPWEAKQILRDLEARLQKFGLELSEEKTSIKEFGRFATENRKRRRERKPETFNFLGFTHYCTRTRDGRFIVRIKTSRKKMSRSLVGMNRWLKSVRNLMPIQDIWKLLALKLQGHYNYYGVSGNFDGINRFYQKTVFLAFKWMNRRSQKKSWNWEGYRKYLTSYPLPRPKLTYAIYNTW
jgi:group II intron reverse transcriptase/maturase